MVKRFLRLFKEYRELEKELEREAALADSLERYIDALEGRDRERLAVIGDLEAKNREALDAIREARAQLARLRPGGKEET
jgi:DNA helicase IV